MKNFTNLLIFLGIISFVIMGCAKSDDSSSSSSSTTTTSDSSDSTSDADDTVSASSGSSAITLSSKISMVSAKTTDSTARTAFATVSTDNLSSTSDYKIDKTQKFVYEKSADALDTVNRILCWIGQTRPDLMVNTGNYKAQVDENGCEERSGDSKSNNPNYTMWRLNATRADGEPMIVKGCVPMDFNSDGAKDGLVHFKAKVWQPPSDDYPIGHFKLDFKFLEGKTASGTQVGRGYMRTRKKGSTSTLQYWEPKTSGSTTYDYSVTAKFNTDGTGSGITTMPKWDQNGPTSTQKTYKVSVGDDYFYKQKSEVTGGTTTTADPVCLDRNKYLKSAWRYGMYNKGTNTDNGSRVTINSGFPIKATKTVSGVSTYYYGYICYHGLWMPSEASVGDNSTVAKMDFSAGANQSGTDYTVRSWGGKLTKWTKNTITLGSIKNVPLNWMDMSDNYTEKRVYWDGDNMTVDGERNTTTWQWDDVTATKFALTSLNAPYGFHFYSQALGGDGSIQLTYGSYPNHTTPAAPADNTSVLFNTREPVFPGDSAPSKLACYDRCPNPATLASGTQTTAYLRFSGVDNASAVNPYYYSFDNTTSGMVLQYDNGTKTPVLLSSANSNLSYGVQSGILFDNTTANYNSLRCSWDNNSICPWNARQAMSTFYTWQTGPEAWDKLTVLVASDNSSVKFDPPMVVKYTHSGTKSNSGKNYDNATFYLEYGGHGDLWGIPSFCVDSKTGDKVSCANDGTTRWVPEFIIKKASLVTQAKDGSTQYLVKPLEIEQTMKKASSASVCTAAGLSFGSVSLPDSEPYSDPDIGERPSISGPPAVVAGAKM